MARARPGGEDVSDQVEPQELHGVQRFSHPQGGGEGSHDNFPHVGGEQEVYRLADIAVGGASPADGVDQGFQIVVGDDHICDVLHHVAAAGPHGHPHVCRFEGGHVVDAVAGHVPPLCQRPAGPAQSPACWRG